MNKTIKINDNTLIDLSLENNILKIDTKESMIEVSDGYHTFNELYDHRVGLFLLVMSLIKKHNKNIRVWYANSEEADWYIAGIDFENGKKTVSYHIPANTKKYLEKINAEYLSELPPFDGCDSNCNLKRIYEILIYNEK